MLDNKRGDDIPTTVLPDGMVDLMVTITDDGNWDVVLRGLDTEPSQVKVEKGIKIFSIGLKLLSVEYLLGDTIKDVLNIGKNIANDFWEFSANDFSSMGKFCRKATQKIKSISADNIDRRKKKLFDLIYASHGSITVKELSEKSYWSSRQINRYFNQQFGISLKTYCNILRVGESFKHISEGKLYPEQNFTDQNHFIKEIKRYSGVTPKELRKNKDNKFINIIAIKKLPS